MVVWHSLTSYPIYFSGNTYVPKVWSSHTTVCYEARHCFLWWESARRISPSDVSRQRQLWSSYRDWLFIESQASSSHSQYVFLDVLEIKKAVISHFHLVKRGTIYSVKLIVLDFFQFVYSWLLNSYWPIACKLRKMIAFIE